MKIQKAYKNMTFLNSPAARQLRILSEFLEPKDRFEKNNIKDAIVFFGSARIKDKQSAQSPEAENDIHRYYADAKNLARMLSEWSLKQWPDQHRFPIMTGGGPGIMKAANEGASMVKKSVNIGLNISLPHEQFSNPFITPELNFDFHYFFSRKFWFINLARVLVVFPGGFGTLDELFELLTLVQTGKISHKVCICLFGKDFWDKIINFQLLTDLGLVNKKDLRMFEKVSDVEQAYTYITDFLKKEYGS